MQSRRSILTSIGAVTSITLAGCLGSDDARPDPPDEETPTEDLLPDTETWPLDEVNEQEAGAIGANDGIQGRWNGPDGERYTMEIMRFSDESSAEDAAEQYVEEFDWFLSLHHGVFSFAVNGPDGIHARELLAASPALNDAIVADRTPDADGFPNGGGEEDDTERDPENEEESGTLSEEGAISVVEEYYDALTRGDADGVNALFHPDSPSERVTQEEVSDMERFSYEFDETEVSSGDGDGTTVTGAVTIIESNEDVDEIEFSFELREHDNGWRVW